MLRRNIFLFVFLVAGCTVFGFAAARISIPAGTQEHVSEQELVELICYEARAKGGEGIARVEALNEVLKPALEKASEMGLSVEHPDLAAMSAEMNRRMEDICQAEDFHEAESRVESYISFTQEVRSLLRDDLADELRQLEISFRQKGEQLKQDLESQLEDEAKELAREAEERLRRQGEEAGRRLESRLKGLAEEFKSIVIPQGEDISPDEVIATAQRLAVGFSDDDPAVDSFLSGKFREILDEARVLAVRASAGEIMPAQAAQEAGRRVPGVVSEIKDFMQEHYRKLGRQAEADIREKLNEKADQIAGEERSKLEDVRDLLSGLEAKIEEVSQQKMARWSDYRQRALDLRREIVSRIVENHFREARQLIEERSDQIEVAIEAGVAEEYGVSSVESLLEELEADRIQIIDRLSEEIDEASLAGIQKEFRDKWNGYRSKMEAIQFPGPERVIEEILDRYDLGFWEARLAEMRAGVEEAESRMASYQSNQAYSAEHCRQNPEVTARPTADQMEQCAVCLSLEEITRIGQERTELHLKNQEHLDRFQETVERLRGYVQDPPTDLGEALAFKNQLQGMGHELSDIRQRATELQREMQQILESNRAACRRLAQ